jgi:RNA recognition motif-containing protein
MGSSAYQRLNPKPQQRKRDAKAEEVNEDVELKKRKFREFLKLSTKPDKQQSWNDQFESFMAQDTKPKKTEKKKDEAVETVAEPVSEGLIVDDKRLYVMNLSYTVTKEELQELFGKYGQIDDIEIPFRKGGRGTPLGLGFVKF